MIAPNVFLGRDEELRRLGELLGDLRAGRGRAVLVEGEAGIGKSALLRVGLGAAAPGRHVLWGAAYELGLRFPMRALLDCLDAEQRTALVGSQSAEDEPWLGDVGDPTLALTERLLGLVRTCCGTGPVVLVLDDLQWADDATLLAWHRLARMVQSLPLLLVGACRPAPQREEIAQLRRALCGSGAVMIGLDRLSGAEVTELVGALVGGEPGRGLLELAERAAGNPLYVRELIEASLRDREAGMPPASLVAAITDRLSGLAGDTGRILRIASLFGTEFVVGDVATVLGVPPTALLAGIQEGIAAGVLEGRAETMAFRHPLIRQVLYEGIPAGVRTALHGQAAQSLAAAGATAERVAEHMLAVDERVFDEWAVDWLAVEVRSLARWAPQVAVTLVEHALEVLPESDHRYEALQSSLVTVQRLLNRFHEAEPLARSLRRRTADPDRASHMAWIVAYCLLGTRRAAEALDVLADALRDCATPPRWVARLRALRAVVLGAVGRYEEAIATAAKALPEGEAAADRYAVALALHAKAQSVARHDTRGALELIEQGLAVAPDGLDGIDLKLLMLGNRVTNLTILDRLEEAGEVTRHALELAESAGTVRRADIKVVAAQRYFAAGLWDDASAALEPAEDMARDLANNLPRLIRFRGLAALMAAHRDDETAREHLDAVRHTVITPGVLRRSADYLMMARAAVAERDGDLAEAIDALAPALDPECAKDVSKRHAILPIVVRLAMARADRDLAEGAVDAAEAGASGLPSHAAAVERCRGLLTGDESLLAAAAGYYRAAGRRLELGETLEDLAELLASAGRVAEARVAFAESIDVYTALRASWDIRRAENRARPYGIRPGRRGPRRRPRSGWAALTPTELMVARMVASGLSNPDIAAKLFLSRRTVQTHVGHILRKLGVPSRVGIARAVLEHSR